jgi:post-segregation antitoxin (ccd killing protein)
MQVYLPDELYALVKQRKLPASELLQDAIRSEVRRRDLLEAAARYTSELAQQVGEPSREERARARAIAKAIVKGRPRKAS